MNGTLHRLAIFFLMLVAACGRKEEKAPETPSTPAAAATAPKKSAADTGTSEKIAIKAADGTRPVEFHLSGTGTRIEGASGLLLRGEMRPDGKRKYERQGGDVIAEVKSEGANFKLRTPDGKLLWKVKDDGAKIKISDNEENANPYVLKRGDDEVSVRENETEIGTVKFYPDRGKVKVKDAGGTELFESNSGGRSAMFGVMLMRRIPETERYIIMAELAARGL